MEYIKGKISFFNPEKGFGFIEPENGEKAVYFKNYGVLGSLNKGVIGDFIVTDDGDGKRSAWGNTLGVPSVFHTNLSGWYMRKNEGDNHTLIFDEGENLVEIEVRPRFYNRSGEKEGVWINHAPETKDGVITVFNGKNYRLKDGYYIDIRFTAEEEAEAERLEEERIKRLEEERAEEERLEKERRAARFAEYAANKIKEIRENPEKEIIINYDYYNYGESYIKIYDYIHNNDNNYDYNHNDAPDGSIIIEVNDYEYDNPTWGVVTEFLKEFRPELFEETPQEKAEREAEEARKAAEEAALKRYKAFLNLINEVKPRLQKLINEVEKLRFIRGWKYTIINAIEAAGFYGEENWGDPSIIYKGAVLGSFKFDKDELKFVFIENQNGEYEEPVSEEPAEEEAAKPDGFICYYSMGKGGKAYGRR